MTYCSQASKGEIDDLVGTSVAIREGKAEGCDELGLLEGTSDGLEVGTIDTLGVSDGISDGAMETDGLALGVSDGISDGSCV